MKVIKDGMLEVEYACQKEIRWVMIGESNSHQSNPSDDMIK
jgi:hypothetical protein